ncbi:hypothetical protein [Streptomyces sp. NBC_00083]|uniref:hypothetical protein n=1 Tax=Streptomyces sp. NBC_00083 TaxID=2975647 RepID=UPI0022577CF2|nr:hypothetical protein [Streptomyces sp. NBC_00083]MCX5382996.1 hypothetical protein [Streptomyces sp. NBC_00083]
MVHTMTFVSALIRTARRARHVTKLSAPFEPGRPHGLTAAGMSDGRDVLLDAPDARLAPALVSAALGEYEAAAKLLATTRELAEWENRDRYTVRLAAFAVNRPEWLADWLAAAPRDPDALLVKAELAIVEAWGSPARAERLRDVAPLILSAADGDPADPVPWRIALDHARGTHASHTVFEELWGEAIRRSSHHYGCHVAALQYLSAQWYGSHRECFDFAERAAEDSLPGSLIRALPARAAFAYMVGGGGHSIPYERIDAAADLGIELSAAYEPGDPWPAEVRNLLAYVLVVRRRWPETLEEFRRIGPYATSFPWLHLAADPLGQFLELREFVRCEVAATMPWGRERQKPGRARSDGHYA